MAKIRRDAASLGYRISTSTGAKAGNATVQDASQFSRFERLTKRLLAVPKSELDEQRSRG